MTYTLKQLIIFSKIGQYGSMEQLTFDAFKMFFPPYNKYMLFKIGEQVITLEGWETTSATNEVQKIMVTSPCVEANSCSRYQYRLVYNMEKTGKL